MSKDTGHVFEHLLDPLVTVYGDPKTGDVQAFLMEYAGLLRDFDAAELAHAKAAIMKTHVHRYFPTPAQCLKACDDAAKALSPMWSQTIGAKIGAAKTLKQLDALWSDEIAPRRNRTSKHSFDVVKRAANVRAHAITTGDAASLTSRSRAMTGEGPE